MWLRNEIYKDTSDKKYHRILQLWLLLGMFQLLYFVQWISSQSFATPLLISTFYHLATVLFYKHSFIVNRVTALLEYIESAFIYVAYQGMWSLWYCQINKWYGHCARSMWYKHSTTIKFVKLQVYTPVKYLYNSANTISNVVLIWKLTPWCDGNEEKPDWK